MDNIQHLNAQIDIKDVTRPSFEVWQMDTPDAIGPPCSQLVAVFYHILDALNYVQTHHGSGPGGGFVLRGKGSNLAKVYPAAKAVA